MNQSGVYVIDFDDILVNMSIDCFRFVRKNWRVFSKYFWDTGELTDEEIEARPFFKMGEWLIQKRYEDLTSGQYTSLQLIISELLKQEYFSSPTIYKSLEPTLFAQRTLMNPLFIDSPNVKQVVILTRNVCENQAKNKREYIDSHFKHPKLSVIEVGVGESKADALKKNNILFDVYIDDEIPNIRDLAEKTQNLTGKEFIIPEYGYNKMPQELKFLIESRGGTFTYYDPNKK